MYYLIDLAMSPIECSPLRGKAMNLAPDAPSVATTQFSCGILFLCLSFVYMASMAYLCIFAGIEEQVCVIEGAQIFVWGYSESQPICKEYMYKVGLF